MNSDGPHLKNALSSKNSFEGVDLKGSTDLSRFTSARIKLVDSMVSAVEKRFGNCTQDRIIKSTKILKFAFWPSESKKDLVKGFIIGQVKHLLS